MDGIDAALLWTDGEGVIEPRGFHSTAYSSPFRQALAECLQAPDRLAPSLEEELTRRHADAVQELLSRFGVTAADIALVGFHGHTVLHRPAERRTWQLGDGGQLAAATGIPVVFDFRSADVAAGGHGAPLAPIFHAGIAASVERPCVFLNLGGIANVTWVGGGADELIAFDTGPANMLLDQWVARHTGEAMDFGGKLALEGKADPKVLAGMMGKPFFQELPPKSLDRLDFDLADVAGLSPEDGAATLAAFTVSSVASAQRYFPSPARRWFVGGGGRHNRAIMDGLRQTLPVSVADAAEIGIDGDALEAQAFAYLAVRRARGLPISFPGTTGVPHPMAGGRIAQP